MKETQRVLRSKQLRSFFGYFCFIINTYLSCSFIWLLCWWVFPWRKFINFAIIQVGVELQFLGLGQFEASLWQFAKPQLQFFRLLQSCEGLNRKKSRISENMSWEELDIFFANLAYVSHIRPDIIQPSMPIQMVAALFQFLLNFCCGNYKRDCSHFGGHWGSPKKVCGSKIGHLCLNFL